MHSKQDVQYRYERNMTESFLFALAEKENVIDNSDNASQSSDDN